MVARLAEECVSKVPSHGEQEALTGIRLLLRRPVPQFHPVRWTVLRRQWHGRSAAVKESCLHGE